VRFRVQEQVKGPAQENPDPVQVRTKRALVHIRRVRRIAAKHVARYSPKAHHWRWGGFVTAALMAAAVFFVIGAGLRLLMGPVSLGPLSGQLQNAIANALPGLAVRYDEAALEWTRDEGRLNLVILGARVFDEDQRIIAQAPKAEIVLAATPFLQGKVEIKHIALVGVQLTMVRTADGRLRLGMEQEQGESDVLEDIRRAIENNSEGASSLQSFAVRKARLAFYDQGTGLFVVAPDAGLEIATSNSKTKKGQVVAGVDAQIEISGHRAHVVGSVKLPQNNGPVKGDFSITGLDVNALGTNAKAFAYLEPYELKADLTGSFVLAGGTHVSYADFGLGAAGTITGFGAPVHVKTLRLVGRYDGRTGRLLIDDGTLAGNEARAHLSGTGDLSFAADDSLSKADLDLTMDQIAVNLHGVTNRTVALDRIALRGEYTPADDHFEVSEFLMHGGPLSVELKGGLNFVKNETPEIDLDGHIAQLDIKDALHYWPLQLGEGAREWIEANVLAGRIGPVQIKTRIPAGALEQDALPDNALDIRLAVSGGTINYIDGMTPLTNVQATGIVTGDTFTGDLSSAKAGALSVSDGHAVIHDLHAHAAVGDFSAHAEGQVTDMLGLIDEKPLQYPTRFHIKSDGAKGTAAVDLAFKLPLLKSLKVSDLNIDVKGSMRDLTLALTDKLKVTNGAVDFAVDNDKLHMSGNVDLSDAKLAVDWTELFNARNPITSTVLVKGTLDDDSRSALNFHTGGILEGPVGVTATLTGHRGSIRHAEMTMDLTPTVLSLDLINYKKPAGVSAGAQMDAQFGDNGSLSSGNIELNGAGGLSAKGSATFGDGAQLEHVSLPYVHAGPANDFALEMTDTSQSGFDLAITGHSADGTGLGRHDFDNEEQAKPAKPSTAPFHIAAHLDHVLMRDGVTVAPFALDTSGVGDRPQSLTLSGTIGKSGTLGANLAMVNGMRQIKFDATDAGQLIKGLFGFGSIHGGTLDMKANLSPQEKVAPGKPPVDYTGSIVIKDMKVTNQPFLARLFSAMSFGGLFDLLRGQGISVDKLEVPFRMHGGVLDLHDASATGPSLGMSADGYLDRRSNKIALEGAIAPLQGINSVLSAIPLVGDVLVSKKGEGVIGVSYKISGNADEPEISVNPLSVFTPGIFRRIFEGTPHAPGEASTGKNNPKKEPDPKTGTAPPNGK
jgi:hypothetical protein